MKDIGPRLQAVPPSVPFPEQNSVPGAFLFGSGLVLGPSRPVLSFGSAPRDVPRAHHVSACHMRDGVRRRRTPRVNQQSCYLQFVD